ncbi:glycosyl transferase (plasmid) [Neorhizobium sp. SOG26]|uniref:glycosyltransferase family 4 protein n=1 Tax=Neorhizobium sp. SOG26 TaxID=2060726 RepID=UPI000E597457|nr:glycosyltransferase family 4 protein [Neorhizobium sp. SOG26]AXV18445.1 glycosyl transferase [Neorhizobium sp. SOG26]
MKIAQIAPLAERVPPKLYGGTERIVSYLTEELVRQGHEVTLFASGDSITDAKLVSACPTALRLDPAVKDPLPHHMILLEEVRRRASDFDVLHFHIDLLHYPMLAHLNVPALTTLHGRLDLPDLQPFYRFFPNQPLVSISDDQRKPMPPVNWAGTVYHGLPRNVLPFTAKPEEDYVAFLGRISPEKRPDRAIEIAGRAGVKLKIAAKIDNADREYWETVIEPMVRESPNVEFVGEISEQQKASFLGNARALLFPIDWPEPFGLVMIEAMACGTPVIAFRNGSVPEIIDHGISGMIVEDISSAVSVLKRLDELPRQNVRETFERRFTVERMAEDYLSIYQHLISGSGSTHQAANNDNLDLQGVA